MPRDTCACKSNAIDSHAVPAGPDGWAFPSNYPELSNGQILRLDWFILFFQFVTAVIVSIVASLGAIPQACSLSLHQAMLCCPTSSRGGMQNISCIVNLH